MTAQFIAYLVNRARETLADEDPANYRWQEHELVSHIQKALREISKVAPYEKKSTLQTMASRDLDISTLVPRVLSYGRRGILKVEYPTGETPSRYRNFEMWGDTLTLKLDHTPPAGKDINIWWAQFHEVTTTSTTLTPELEDIVVEGLSAYAMLAWGQAHLNDVNVGGAAVASQMVTMGITKLGLFRQALDRLRPILITQEYDEGA